MSQNLKGKEKISSIYVITDSDGEVDRDEGEDEDDELSRVYALRDDKDDGDIEQFQLYPDPVPLPMKMRIGAFISKLRITKRKFDIELISALIFMIAISTIDSIMYTRLSYKMVNYEWFLSQIATTIGFIVLIWPIIIVKILRGVITKSMRQFPKKWFLLIAVLDGTSGLLSTLPTPYIPGPLLIIIGKIGIIFTMLFSFFILNVRYKATHYIGAALIGIGVVVSVYPKLDSASTFESNSFWFFMFMSASIPSAFSNVYQEKILKSGKGDMDIWYFSGMVAIYQLFVGFGTAWTVFISLPPPSTHIQITQFPEYLLESTGCLLGLSSENNTASHCEFSWLIFGIFIVFNITFNILITYVMQRGSATLAIIASTTTFALTSLGYHIPIIAGEADVGPVTMYGFLSLIIIIMAIFVYKLQDEIRVEKPKENKVQFSDIVTKKVIDTSECNGEEQEYSIPLKDDS